MRPERFDLVVLGGGLAGLTAANRALQLGLSAALIEQGEGDKYPCNTRYSGGILHLAFQNVKDAPENLRRAMDDATFQSSDPELLRALAETSGRAVDWLQKEGARFIHVGQIVWQQFVLAPPRPLTPGLDWNGRGPDVTLRTLMDSFKRRGGRVFLNAAGSELLERDGRCGGVKVSTPDKPGIVEGSAVLIADGGFQANLDLVRQHISPQPEKLLQRGAANARGAGLRMAMAMGAEVSDLSTFYGHLLIQDAFANPKLWPYPQLDELATAGLIVSKSGERVADEGRGGVNLANQIARRTDPRDCFVVFDEEIWQSAAKNARIPANPNLVRGGARFISAGSLEALAAAMGVPPERLTRTVEAYNHALQVGQPGLLNPPRSATKYTPMALKRAPFHALPICAGITHTTGGILIDHRARVRRKGGGTVPGLYAAGSASGGIEGGPHAGYVGGLMKALAFGLLAAEDVAAEKRL